MESEGLWDITGDVQKAVCVELRRVMGAGESGDLSREELFTAKVWLRHPERVEGNQLRHQYGHLGYCHSLGMEPWYHV